MSLSRREALKALGALATLRLDPNALAPSQPHRAAPPNIVFIMTDDQRHDALSAAGNTILRTPNIDRIAGEGVRFADAFVTNALCAPSRASILTGLYSHAHGVITNGGGPQYYNQPGLRIEQPTFVDLLQSAGYHTALIGKWHQRSDPR
jgi:arylsulfatase A-like enzyme